MVNRPLQSKSRYLVAFIIGTLIFILGFAISYGVSYFELSRIGYYQQTTGYDIFLDKIQYSFFDKDICSVESFKEISRDLGFQGRLIDDLERKLGKENEVVLFRKQFYSLVELEHLEFVKNRNIECDDFVNTILFFYSNEPEYISESERVGEILGVVHARNDNLAIYSFDVNLDSVLVDNLKKKYGVSGQQSIIVINEEITLDNIRNASGVESWFK